MTDTGDVEGDLPLTMQHPGALVQPPGQQHHPVHLQERVLGQSHLSASALPLMFLPHAILLGKDPLQGTSGAWSQPTGPLVVVILQKGATAARKSYPVRSGISSEGVPRQRPYGFMTLPGTSVQAQLTRYRWAAG